MDRTAELARFAAARAPEGVPLDELLAEALPGNDLNTLLLHALRTRARKRGLEAVLSDSRRRSTAWIAGLDAREMMSVDAAFFATASAFEAVEPSPVLPLGSTALAGVEPNHVVCAPRGLEVASDPSVALFLEIDRRRAAGTSAPIHLAASQRVVRMNPLVDPRHSPHFRLAALASAERGGDALASLYEHASTWLRLFAALQAQGRPIAGMGVEASDTRLVAAVIRSRGGDPAEVARKARAHDAEATALALREAGLDDREGVLADLPERAAKLVSGLETAFLAPLRAAWPGLDAAVDPTRLHGLGYYDGPTVKISIHHADGFPVSIGDGGAVPWLARARSDRRERLVTSGIGIELVVRLFGVRAG